MLKKIIFIIILSISIFFYYFRYSAYCHYREMTLPSYQVPLGGDQCERFNFIKNRKIVVCLDSMGNFLSVDGLNSGIYLYDEKEKFLAFYHLYNEVWQGQPISLILEENGKFNLGLYAQTRYFDINPSFIHRIEAKFIEKSCQN